MSGRATRDAYAHALLELAEAEERLVVFDSDLARSTRTEWFAAEYPGRFFNAGIAEANMVSMAAGMASVGLLPFVTTYAIFIGRAFDQIRQSVAYAGAGVKVVATHSGLAAAHDGGSHQGVEDLALMRALPAMTVLSPADYPSAKEAVHRAAATPHPTYLRLGKFPVPDLPPPVRSGPNGDRVMREGEDLAILATGPLVADALRAADILAANGIAATVIDVTVLKPFDRKLAVRAAECGCVVTAEEHNAIGGLFSALLEALAEEGLSARVAPVALRDEFGQSGSWPELREHYRLTDAGILSAAERVLAGEVRR